MVPYTRHQIEEADIDAVTRALRSGCITQGPEVARFEADLAQRTAAPHAVAVANGSVALDLAVAALDIGPGCIGLTTPVTFAASASCFLRNGATVRFVDVDPETGLMTPEALRRAIEEARAEGFAKGAVVTVSLAGQAPDLAGLAEVCAEADWPLIEDAAHSIGATYSTDYPSASCRHTAAATLSFHPAKHVCAGEGGAVLTRDPAVATRLRRLRSHGVERPWPNSAPGQPAAWTYEQVELGWNARLSELHAALGRSQLSRLDTSLERRLALASRYREAFTESPFRPLLKLPPIDPGHAHHLFPVHFPDAPTRDAAYTYLRNEADIHTQVHYVPLYRFPTFAAHGQSTDFPGAEAYFDGVLSLPMFPGLTDAAQTRVLQALSTFCDLELQRRKIAS